MNITPESFAELEAELEIISKISSQFDPRSAPGITLRRAAIALFFATVHHGETFDEFCTNFDRVLSEEQKERLKELGLQTDS